MASTRAEFGLGKSGKDRRNLPPSGERTSKRARMPRPKPPAALAPNPPEEPAEEGAAGPVGKGADPPFGALPSEATLRPSERSPPERSRVSVSAQDACAAAMRAPSSATTVGGPRTPQALDASLVGTAKAPGRPHAGVFIAAGSRPEGGRPIVVARLSGPRGAPNVASGTGDDVPAAGNAPVTGANIGSGASGAGAPPTGSSA
jgi:hypothetical protein